MSAYAALSAILGDRDTCAVDVGTIGGWPGSSGFTRHARITRTAGTLTVSIYGNDVAELDPDGTIRVRTAGYYTPSTRAALSLAVTGHPYAGAVTMSTPGSRGGKPGPWRALVHYAGSTTPVGDDWPPLPTPDHEETSR